MAHPLAANFCARYFNAALIADDSLMLNSLISSAVAFPVLCRSKNPLAEKSILFRLERAVIDSLGLCDLAS